MKVPEYSNHQYHSEYRKFLDNHRTNSRHFHSFCSNLHFIVFAYNHKLPYHPDPTIEMKTQTFTSAREADVESKSDFAASIAARDPEDWLIRVRQAEWVFLSLFLSYSLCATSIEDMSWMQCIICSSSIWSLDGTWKGRLLVSELKNLNDEAAVVEIMVEDPVVLWCENLSQSSYSSRIEC